LGEEGAMAQREPKLRRVRIPTGSGPLNSTEIRYFAGSRPGWRDAYHYLLTMPLPAFLGVMAAIYLAINLVFAAVYALVGGVTGMPRGDFAAAFFFSVETISTVGYGVMAPKGLGAHLVVTAESFVGLFNLAIMTGLMFNRISRPTARVMFSDKAVITNYEGEPTLIFRAANQRRNRVVEAEVSVTLLHEVRTREGDMIRRFETLPTIRSRSPVFMLTWQIMHRIDELSPLLGETAESLAARNAQILVVLKGIDETFAQTVHARGGYMADQIVWGARFAEIFTHDDEGRAVIDYTHFHDVV
jgi:inward rectifier potassium channel